MICYSHQQPSQWCMYSSEYDLAQRETGSERPILAFRHGAEPAIEYFTLIDHINTPQIKIQIMDQ
jgi:hypothetical protein